MPLNERIPKPSENSYARTTQRRFPKLSATAVQAFMEENRPNVERERNFKPKVTPRKRVPEGSRPSKSLKINSKALGLSVRSVRLVAGRLRFHSRSGHTKDFKSSIRSFPPGARHKWKCKRFSVCLLFGKYVL